MDEIDWRGWPITVGVGLTSFAIGVATGYLARDAQIKQRLDDIEEEHVGVQFEIEQQNRRFNRVLKEIELTTDRLKEDYEGFLDRPRSEIAKSLHPTGAASRRDNGQPAVPVSYQEDVDWDYEAEKELRTKDRPYIIHYEEYFDDGTVEEEYVSFSKATLTYYKTDDVLTDSDDVPVYNYQTILGELKFGHGSRDPSVVYIRNEHLHSDFEVTLNEGSFTLEVLGEEIEKDLGEGDLKHSVRKFKRD